MSKNVRNDAAVIRAAARSVASDAAFGPLVELAGAAQCVLIGEASHGTHEFYETRAELTKRLVEEKGFRAVALEADWPDTFRVHRFVTGRGGDGNANDALSDFRRFPGWMWRNTVMLEFVEWLRAWNAERKAEKGFAGIYGLDLYSMHTSIDAVLGYLDKVDSLRTRRLERAIGVIYRPETERLSHYFEARLPDQFDAVIHLDETSALEPLEPSSEWEHGELPETYPSAL